jgi:hypothetical protein
VPEEVSQLQGLFALLEEHLDCPLGLAEVADEPGAHSTLLLMKLMTVSLPSTSTTATIRRISSG